MTDLPSDDEWLEDVLEERRCRCIYDRMDSYITGVMAGAVFLGFTMILSLFIPGVAMVLGVVGFFLFSRHHERSIQKDDELEYGE